MKKKISTAAIIGVSTLLANDTKTNITWQNGVGKVQEEPQLIQGKTSYIQPTNEGYSIRHSLEMQTQVIKNYYSEKVYSNGMVERINNCPLSCAYCYARAEEKFNGAN